MASIEFTVHVEVDDWPDGPDEHGRTADHYAMSALYCASLSDASCLDGFADLDGPSARITDVFQD